MFQLLGPGRGNRTRMKDGRIQSLVLLDAIINVITTLTQTKKEQARRVRIVLSITCITMTFPEACCILTNKEIISRGCAAGGCSDRHHHFASRCVEYSLTVFVLLPMQVLVDMKYGLGQVLTAYYSTCDLSSTFSVQGSHELHRCCSLRFREMMQTVQMVIKLLITVLLYTNKYISFTRLL